MHSFMYNCDFQQVLWSFQGLDAVYVYIPYANRYPYPSPLLWMCMNAFLLQFDSLCPHLISTLTSRYVSPLFTIAFDTGSMSDSINLPMHCVTIIFIS